MRNIPFQILPSSCFLHPYKFSLFNANGIMYAFKQFTKFPILPLFSPKPSSLPPPPLTLTLRGYFRKMALKAINVSDVPHLHHVPENPSVSVISSSCLSKGVEMERNASFKGGDFMVIGHRGNGMNRLHLEDPRMKKMKENSILSFNAAAAFNVDYIEFDVQVTKDDYPIIFHDDFILSEENGTIYEKRVTDLSLSEFVAYGPQKEAGKVGKPLLRKTKDGKIIRWDVALDDALCTLQEAFEKVDPKLGFNIELKFDDNIVYQEDFLVSFLQAILKVAFEYAKERPIIFSTFQPDAALHMRKLQSTYPVLFLTNGGTEIYYDVRRNSLEEALKLCLEGDLQGIVSEVKGIFRNPAAVSKIKESKLMLLTYGTLNNVPESVYLQHLMGIDGVIVDFVQEITEAVKGLIKSTKTREDISLEEEGKSLSEAKPQFSQRELSFLLKLIPELIQQ